MKHIISIVLVCFLFSSFSFGQNTRDISLSYKQKDFALFENAKGQKMIQSEKRDVTYKSDTSCPGIPYIGINVVVSPSEVFSSVSLSGDEIIVGEEVELAPNPKYIPSSTVSGYDATQDTVVYKKALYPSKCIEYAGCSKMRGYKILSFLISPFRYDAAKKKLIFIDNPVVKLITSGSEIKGTSNCFGNLVKEMVVNADELNTLYPETAANDRTSNTINCEYLIITNAALESIFQNLADWKTLKGVPTQVLTTEYISTNYTGSDLQAKIKKALKFYYDNTGEKLTYVLLGGDVEVVPTKMCYATYDNQVRNMPTDLYYACFDTMDWDTNNNGISGEISDNVDILPEVYVSRASVSNVTEAEIFVNRVISYESNPLWGTNAKKILMAGTKRYEYFQTNMGVQSDSQAQSYYLYRGYVSPFWNGDQIEFFDTHTDFPGDDEYDFSSEHLQDQLENGYGFVHVMTHGNPWVWSMEPANDFYSIYNASSQNNQGETIILTSSCLTNAFDSVTVNYNSCLSERLMRNPNSGVLGYVGCSREGIGSDSPINIGPSNHIDGEIMKKFFTLWNNNFARCVTEGKNTRIASCYSYDDPFRWLLFGVNALGDPEMPIYTITPQVFNNVSITYFDRLYVNTNVDSCRICLMGRDNVAYYCLDNVSSMNGGRLISGEYCVCITKPGYIPYIYIFSVDQGICLQNESFMAKKTDVVSTNVSIGSDVNTSAPQGPVTIGERANVKINASQGVLIKNNFEVKAGATFEITQ